MHFLLVAIQRKATSFRIINKWVNDLWVLSRAPVLGWIGQMEAILPSPLLTVYVVGDENSRSNKIITIKIEILIQVWVFFSQWDYVRDEHNLYTQPSSHTLKMGLWY